MNNKPKEIWLLGGQGSQYFQMGRTLYEEDASVKFWMQKLDRLYENNLGISVVNELYFAGKDKSEIFNDLHITHPAIFMLQYALGQSMLEQGETPSFLMAYSHGELVALALAGAIDCNMAMDLIYKEVQTIEKLCAPCIMMVVMTGLIGYYSHPWLYNRSTLVSEEGGNQIVITFPKHQEVLINKGLNQNELGFFKLPVTYGFHAEHIDTAKDELLSYYQLINWKEPQWPIFSCRTQSFLSCSEADKTNILWKRIRSKFSIFKSLKILSQIYTEEHFRDISPNAIFYNQILKMKREKIIDTSLHSSFMISPFRKHSARV